MGISRSASIVISYLMASKSMGFKAAFNHVKDIRQCIDPNPVRIDYLSTFYLSLIIKNR